MKIVASLVILLVLIGGTAYIFREPLLLAIGGFLNIREPLQPADVIHVISGPDYRTRYGIWLYKQGYAKYIFYTGGWCAEIQGVHAERSRSQSIEQGIPVSAIATDSYQVTSTYQEAQRLKLWIDQSHTPVRSVILVSDPFHMRRSRWTYQQVLGKGIQVIMAPIPFDQTPYQQRWWTDPSSMQYVKDEYLKLAYYYARYRFSWGPLKQWLVSLDQE